MNGPGTLFPEYFGFAQDEPLPECKHGRFEMMAQVNLFDGRTEMLCGGCGMTLAYGFGTPQRQDGIR